MRMRIYAYTLCARMLISMYELAGLFFLLLIVDCSFNDRPDVAAFKSAWKNE